MSVASITSSNSAYVSALQKQPDSNAVQAVGRERENDGDKDDRATTTPAALASVNLSGQLTGTTVNTTA